jgi:hypothetical protein
MALAALPPPVSKMPRCASLRAEERASLTLAREVLASSSGERRGTVLARERRCAST